MADDSVNVTITATTAQLRAELALAQAQTRALNTEVANLSNQMVASGATMDKALVSALASASSEAAASAQRVQSLTNELKAADGAVSGMHGSISTATREFRALFDELSSGRTRQTPGTLAIIAQRVFGLGPAALAATGAIAGLVGVFAYLAIEMERAAQAAEAGQAAFAFKGIDVSKEEIQGLAQEIFNLSGSSEKMTAAVLRSFSSIQGATPALREDLAALIPAFEKATGDNVQQAGEKLAGIFTDLGKNGKSFLESLNQTPAVTQALDDFNQALAHGDTATAERVVLQQLQEALERVNKTTEDSGSFWSIFNQQMASSLGNSAAITDAINKEAQAFKNLNASAVANPTTKPQTAETREAFQTDLNGMRDDVSKTQAQITNDEIAAYNRRIDELKRFGLNYQQEVAERNALIAQAERQGGENAEAITREQISQIGADQTKSRTQQLQESVEAWNRLLTSHKLTADQEVAVEREKNQAIAELNRASLQEQQQIAKSNADTQIAISRLQLEEQKANLESDLAAHKINADQKYQEAVKLTQELAALDIQQLENEQKTYQAGTAAFVENANKIKEAQAKLNADLAALQHQHLADMQNANKQEAQSWAGMVNEIENSESSMVRNLITGRQSFAQSALQIAGNLVSQEIANDLKAMTTRLLLAETEEARKKALEQGGLIYHGIVSLLETADTEKSAAAQVAAVTAGEQGKVAAVVAGATESRAASAAIGASTVMSDAAKAFSGAYSAVAGIPYVGPILAPIAGATAFAAVAAYRALASSEGGDWDTGSITRLNVIHPHETIIPAGIAGPMRDFFSGGGGVTAGDGGTAVGSAGTGGGGGQPVQVSLTVNAIDTQTGTEFLRNNIGTIASGLAMQLRIGSNTLRSAAQPGI